MAGTRGGLGRIVAMVIGLAVLLSAALAGEARGGVYRVAQCGWGVGAELDPTYPAIEGPAYSFNPALCAPLPGAGPAGMKFEAGIAPDGAKGLARARWVAPAGTVFTAADATWSGSLEAGIWQGLAVDVGSAIHLLVGSAGGGGPTPVHLQIAEPAWAFEAFLECLVSGPAANCTRSAPSVMRLSDVTFTLEDSRPPGATLGGALVAAGWHRGTVPLELSAVDAGAGVAEEVATVDGTPVLSAAPACAVATIEGQSRATRLSPCPATAAQTVGVDTTRLADGPHVLRGCATDFSGGQGCAADLRLEVDNSPPAISFAAAAEGEVAATLGDRWSGPAAGTISVRRADAAAWTDLPTTFDAEGAGAATLTARLPDLSAGIWFLRAAATDAAGNGGSAQLRIAGGSAELRHQAANGRGPRRASSHGTRTHLGARLVPGAAVAFGTAAEVRGRLTDARGRGIAGRVLAVIVRPAAGGGAPERHRVLTDTAGRFALRLAPGTSRRVAVAFHGGGGFAAAPRRSLDLRVRAGVTFTAEPTELHTGDSVRLRGRVRLGPGHLSGRGRPIAIQYLERATGRWRPALVVRTDAAGRFDTTYRFRYVTGVARIRLRATAPAEGGWPFARGSSSPVTLTVTGG